MHSWNLLTCAPDCPSKPCVRRRPRVRAHHSNRSGRRRAFFRAAAATTVAATVRLMTLLLPLPDAATTVRLRSSGNRKHLQDQLYLVVDQVSRNQSLHRSVITAVCDIIYVLAGQIRFALIILACFQLGLAFRSRSAHGRALNGSDLGQTFYVCVSDEQKETHSSTFMRTVVRISTLN
jgi:hypothetical protein